MNEIAEMNTPSCEGLRFDELSLDLPPLSLKSWNVA